MSKLELAWAAGLFDGEGSFYVSNGYMYAHVTQAGSPHVLRRFKKAVGIGKIYGPYKKSNAKWKDYSKWQAISMADCDHLFRSIGPYLSPVKKKQYRDVRKRARKPEFSRPRPTPSHCPQGHPYNKTNRGKRTKNGRKTTYCKPCAREANRKSYQKRKVA